jgi:hypothetical protein
MRAAGAGDVDDFDGAMRAGGNMSNSHAFFDFCSIAARARSFINTLSNSTYRSPGDSAT